MMSGSGQTACGSHKDGLDPAGSVSAAGASSADPAHAGTASPVDNRDVLEIDVEFRNDTFDVEAKVVDQMDIRVRMPPRLKVGVGIVVFSFIMSGSAVVILPWAVATGNKALQLWAAIVYAGSWVVMGVGIAVGGRAAKEIVTGWRVRAMGKRFGSRSQDRKSI